MNNNRSNSQFVSVYRNAGLISPRMVITIQRLVNNFIFCQKFAKSSVKPKVTLPKVGSFHEIVTLNLKEFRNKYVLGGTDSFTRLMQESFIPNNKAVPIVYVVNDCWNMASGISAVGYNTHNGI